LNAQGEKTEPTYRRPNPQIVANEPEIATEVARWFAGRGISIGTLRAAKIFSTFRWLPATGKPTQVTAFPYFKHGELVNVKYRDAKKNMTQEKNPEPCLFNIDLCRDMETIYICEGEIDVLTLMECDYLAACSVDKGAPNPDDKNVDKKLECVDNCLDVLKNAVKVVLVTDKDEPGLRLEKLIIERLDAGKCFLTRYPSDCKDINDVLMKHGPDAVRESIESARPAPVPGLSDFAEFSKDIYRLYDHGNPKGLSTGWPALDQIFTLQPGSLNVFTGIPMSGKSEFVHALLVNAIKMHGWSIGLFSPEMLPPENLFQNFSEKIIGKPFFGKDRMTKEEVARCIDFVSENIKPIIPEENSTPTLDNIIAAARVCVARYNIKALVLDPYNEIEHTRPAWMSETEYISLFLGRLRTFARMHGVWVGVVAHPVKLKKDERTKEYPIPTLYDISGSANWRNKADNGISLWRSFKQRNNLVEVHIQKVKNKGIGKLGTQVFAWDFITGQYHAITEDQLDPTPDRKDYLDQWNQSQFSYD
jgi:twinkle protein